MTGGDIALVLEGAVACPQEAQLKVIRAALVIDHEHGIDRLSDAERTDLREAEGEFDRGEVVSESTVAKTFVRLRGK